MPYVVTSDGARIRYRIEGDRGPWVILLQGLGLSGRFWFSVPGRLAADPGAPCRVLVVDNRGTGGSDTPRRPWGMARMADDALCVLQAERADRAVVVGISMGGMIAQHMALRRPGRVAGLVIMASGPGLPFGRLPGARTIADLASLRFIAENEVFAKLALLMLPEAEQSRAHEILAEWPDALREEAPCKKAFLVHLAAVAAHSTGLRLGRIRCPTVVVTGAEDRLMPPANSRILAERIPGARYLELPGVGHAIPDQDPDAVGRMVAMLTGR